MTEQPRDLRTHEQAVLRNRIAFAQGNATGLRESAHLHEQQIAVARGADQAQQLEHAWRALLAVATERAADLEEPADEERGPRARRPAEVGGPHLELGAEPPGELRRAGGLARAVAAQQRDQSAAVGETQTRGPRQQPQLASHAAQQQSVRGPMRVGAQPPMQFPPEPQPQPARDAGAQRPGARIEERNVDGGQQLFELREESPAIDLREEVRELRLRRAQPARLTLSEQIEQAVALHGAQHEDEELELGLRNGEGQARSRGVQQGALDGQAVHRGPVAAQSQPHVHVHMDERALVRIIAEPAGGPRNQSLRRRERELEPQPIEHAVETLRQGGIDEQVDVTGAALPVGSFVVPLPLAAADPAEVQGFAQPVQ